MTQRDYRGDVLTLHVNMDAANSATLNGRRIECDPGANLRPVVIRRAAAHALRVGRALPVIVQEQKAECTLLVHPDGRVEGVGLRGRQRAYRWLPAEQPPTPPAQPPTPPAQPPTPPAPSTSASQPGRGGSTVRDGGATGGRPLRGVRRSSRSTAASELPAQDRRAALPRFGERPDAWSDRSVLAAPEDEPSAGVEYDDTIRLAAQQLGLTPRALAAALRAVGPEADDSATATTEES